MGSIPVRSTKNGECSLASAIFFALFRESVLGSSIRQSRILAEGSRLRETANSRFIKYFCVYHLPGNSRLRETANSHRTKRLAVFFSPVGRNDLQSFFLPSDKTNCSHFFEILFNAKTTFSCVSGIK